jgi:DNA-directed RNA polymerase specialized sigma24 family protein
MTEEPDEPLGQDTGYERLQAEDVDKEIRALLGSPADFARLRSIAFTLAAGVTGLTGDDLLNEAVVRFYEGRRAWPRGVHSLVVFKSAMHSLASDMRKRNVLSPVDETAALATTEEAEDSTDTRRKVHGALTLTPEDDLSGKEQLAAVYAVVAGDEELELLVMVWADGLRGDEAAKELDWDKKKYEAARKRLNRRLDALDPDRRMK